jgi:hypothetical protein
MNAKALGLVLAPVVAAGGYHFWPKAHLLPLESPSKASAAIVALTAVAALSAHGESDQAVIAEPAAPEATDLQTALAQGVIKGEFKGNGRDSIRASLANPGKVGVRARAEVGMVFESGRNAVIVVRPTEVEIAPGKTVEATFQTAATRTANKVETASYQPTYQHVPRTELFLTYVQDHLELTPGAIQTAILALTENLPLHSIAKFTCGTSELASRFNTDAFRVETYDILTALAALREAGVPDASIAMTVDPQLRIEAMIEPLCRPAAMRYYGISAESEWSYWKNELLSGEPSTRHYALYGIARFYPEVAVEMLPKWALETKTSNVFRIAALQALADTQRPEAINILQRLSDQLGRETELGRAARGAALALDQRLNQIATVRSGAVAFRASAAPAQF